jgi:hypothetical protein
MPNVKICCELLHEGERLAVWAAPVTETRAAMQHTTDTETVAPAPLKQPTLPQEYFAVTVRCTTRQSSSQCNGECCDNVCAEPDAVLNNSDNTSNSNSGSSSSGSSSDELKESQSAAQAPMLHVHTERFAKLVRQHEVWNRSVTKTKTEQSSYAVSRTNKRESQPQPHQQQRTVGNYTETRLKHERKRSAVFTDDLCVNKSRFAKWRRCCYCDSNSDCS